MTLYGHSQGVEEFRAAYATYGAWIILLKGLTPIPYKIVTIASGFAGYDFFLFVVLSFITRGLRFWIVAELLRHYGAPIQEFIEKRLTLVTTGLLVIIVGGFVLARYVI
jgi:membrane protein YqaA with SNARE-associated domain